MTFSVTFCLAHTPDSYGQQRTAMDRKRDCVMSYTPKHPGASVSRSFLVGSLVGFEIRAKQAVQVIQGGGGSSEARHPHGKPTALQWPEPFAIKRRAGMCPFSEGGICRKTPDIPGIPWRFIPMPFHRFREFLLQNRPPVSVILPPRRRI